MGNTWDGNLTKKIMGVAVDFVQHLVSERSAEPTTLERVAARFATLIVRVKLPARRATRRWRGVCRRARRAAAEWSGSQWHADCAFYRCGGSAGSVRSTSQLPCGTYSCGLRRVAQRLRLVGKGRQLACRDQAASSCRRSSTLDLVMVGGSMKFKECVAITKE